MTLKPLRLEGLKFFIEFFEWPKRNMKNRLIRLYDKLLSRKRSIVETMIDQLKNISGIEHSRHRSPVNFCVNLRQFKNETHQPQELTEKGSSGIV